MAAAEPRALVVAASARLRGEGAKARSAKGATEVEADAFQSGECRTRGFPHRPLVRDCWPKRAPHRTRRAGLSKDLALTANSSALFLGGAQEPSPGGPHPPEDRPGRRSFSAFFRYARRSNPE